MSVTEKFEQLCDRLRGLLNVPLFILWAIPLIITWRLLVSSPADPDLFARVAMGHLTLSLNYVPLKDPFAFTPTLPTWVDHEWLSGVVFYLIAAGLGDAGLIILKVVLAALSVLCVVAASQRYAPKFGGRFVWITLCVLHAAAAWTSTVRCQAFTYLFIPMLYWAIIEYRKERHILPLALSPILAIAWVNMHGGYALGCVLIALLVGVELIERRLSRALVAIAAAWALAPVFTPYGLTEFVSFLVGSLGMDRPGILEWMPLHSDGTGFALTALLSVALVVGIFTRKQPRDLFGLAVIFFSGYCAFRHIRFLPFFMITAAIFGAPYVEAAVDTVGALRPRLTIAALRSGALVCVALIGMGALHLAMLIASPRTYKLDYANMPVGAVEWLRTTRTEGRLLVDFNTGSYALWRLYPTMKISVDGRYEECYPEETVRDNALAFRPDLAVGRAALERFEPTHILVRRSDAVRNPETAFGDGWRVVYRDRDAVVLSQSGVAEAVEATEVASVPGDMWGPRF